MLEVMQCSCYSIRTSAIFLKLYHTYFRRAKPLRLRQNWETHLRCRCKSLETVGHDSNSYRLLLRDSHRSISRRTASMLVLWHDPRRNIPHFAVLKVEHMSLLYYHSLHRTQIVSLVPLNSFAIRCRRTAVAFDH